MLADRIVGPRFPSFVPCPGAGLPLLWGVACVWGSAGARSWPLLTAGTAAAAEGQNPDIAVPGLGCSRHPKEWATAQES